MSTCRAKVETLMWPHPNEGLGSARLGASPPGPREFILRTLLEQYERSKSFAATGPWRRDCILRIDKNSLPEYFAADGRERLAALQLAASILQKEGAVRLSYVESFGERHLHEIRLGPNELSVAYRVAESFSFLPLATALTQTTSHIEMLQTREAAAWMKTYLASVSQRMPAGDLSPLGMQRERFKRDFPCVLDALTAAVALSWGVDEWERMLSERLYRNSKRLAAIRPLVTAILVQADPRWLELDDEDVLPAYGVRRKPGFIACAGGASLSIAGRSYELSDFSPVAHLPDAWSPALTATLASSSIRTVTTIENEFPFLSYAEEAGGPAGLMARHELVVFTSGFPTPRLIDTLVEINRLRPDLLWRHWGDADGGGLRIWWFLRTRLGRPIQLFRTTAEWVRVAGEQGATPLQESERHALRRLRQQLATQDSAADIEQACELIEVLLQMQIKVEQERF